MSSSLKKITGFTLLEVMAALAVIAVMATTVLGVQMTMMRTTSRATKVFERLGHMATFLRKAEMESTIPKSESFEKRAKISNPALELAYTARKPAKGSKLSNFKDLFIERVESTWVNEQNKKISDSLVTFLYRPKEAEKEKIEQAQLPAAVPALGDTQNQKTSTGAGK